MKTLAAKKGDRHADTSELEKAIDNLVYKLYQLTYDEVKAINPEFEREHLTLEHLLKTRGLSPLF